jgi:hypothetical protein
MSTARQLREEQREAFIRMFYDLVNGTEDKVVAPTQWKDISRHLGIPDKEADNIVQYWQADRILGGTAWCWLTHEGKVLVEELIQGEKGSALIKEATHVTNVYNLSGTHSRVNIQSHDHSVNVSTVTPEELFARLRAEIQATIADDQQQEILLRLDELEKARGSSNIVNRYQQFMASAAAHAQVMQLLIPYIPALTQMLK